MAMDVRAQKWTAVNQSIGVPTISQDSENNDDGFSSDTENLMASQYRSNILSKARCIAFSYNKQKLKRESVIETSRAIKRSRLETAPKVKRSRPKGRPVALPRTVYAAAKPVLPEQEQQCSPVKRYLQPTKQTRLNKASGCQITKSKSSAQQQASHDLCTKNENHKNFSNEPSTTVVVRPKSLNLQANEQNLEQSMATFERLEHKSYSVDMELDLDESFFDTSDEEPWSGKTPSTNERGDSKKHSSEPELSTEDLLSSPIVLTQQDDTESVQLPNSVSPFLRHEAAEPLTDIKYSAIPRLVSSLRVQTCFRIAEALRILRVQPIIGGPGPRVTLELFAIITDVHKSASSDEQTARLADIFFPDRPPYLEGTTKTPFVSPIMHPVTATVISDMRTPQPGKIYRFIVHSPTSHFNANTTTSNPSAHQSMTRSKPTQPSITKVTIVTLRETTWDEVNYVRGIVDPEGVRLDKQKKSEAAIQTQSAC